MRAYIVTILSYILAMFVRGARIINTIYVQASRIRLYRTNRILYSGYRTPHIRQNWLRSTLARGPPPAFVVLLTLFISTPIITAPVIVNAAVVYSNDFEANLTGLANVAGYTRDTADGIRISGTGAAKNTNVGSNVLIINGSTDGNNGDAEVSAYGYVVDFTSTRILRVFGRSTSNSNYNNNYHCDVTSLGFQLYRRVGGSDTTAGGSQLGSTVGSGATFTAATWYKIVLGCQGTTIRAKVQRHSDSQWLQPGGTWTSSETWTISVTDSTYTAAGYWGLGYTAGVTSSFYFDDLVLQTFPALSIGAPSITNVTTTSVTTAVTPAGGTAPYSYQWHIGTTANFTVSGGTVVSGATAAASIISGNGLSANTAKFLKVVVTDSAGTPASITSGAVWARLGVLPNSLRFGALGDSIGISPNSTTDNHVVWEAELLKQLGGFRNVDYFNGHISGSNSSNDVNGWGTTATSTTNIAGQTGNYLTGFKGKLVALWGTPNPVSNPVWVIISVGRNDALGNTVLATYQSQLSAIINDLVSAGFSVILDAPIASAPGASSWSDAKTDLTISYQTAHAALANGTIIRIGDRECPVLMGMFIQLYADLIHPNSEGARRMAILKAYAHLRIFNTTVFGLPRPPIGGGPVRRSSLKRQDLRKGKAIAWTSR